LVALAGLLKWGVDSSLSVFCLYACLLCSSLCVSLCRHASSNNIRINLLKMVSLLFAAHPCPAQLAADANLVPVLHSLLEDKSAVIVGSLTQKLLTQYIHAAPPAKTTTNSDA
jgi:hypothetical protein